MWLRRCSSSSRISTRIAPCSTRRLAWRGGIEGRDMGGLLAFPAFLGPAEKTVQGCEQFLDAGIGDPVPKRLRIAPECDDAFGAQLGEVLRQRRLAQAHRFGERRDIGLAPF